MDKLHAQQVNEIVNKSCGCKLGPKGTACSIQFTREVITEQRENCEILDKAALDMLVLGQSKLTQQTQPAQMQLGRSILLSFSKAGISVASYLCFFIHVH